MLAVPAASGHRPTRPVVVSVATSGPSTRDRRAGGRHAHSARSPAEGQALSLDRQASDLNPQKNPASEDTKAPSTSSSIGPRRVRFRSPVYTGGEPVPGGPSRSWNHWFHSSVVPALVPFPMIIGNHSSGRVSDVNWSLRSAIAHGR
jgi:hypothetical protein